MKEEDIKYFNKEEEFKNLIFLSRFPDLNVNNKKVLDLGCGHGALSIELAQKGATEVIGIDIASERIDFANENLHTNYKELIDTVFFKNCSLSNLEDEIFDIIISKATFEHIIHLEYVMKEIHAKLIVGGKLYTGFGPLFNSPWGDHNRLKHKLPWGHLFFKKHLIKKLNTKHKKRISNIQELNLNGLSLKDYLNIFLNIESFELIDFRTNVSTKILNKIFKLISKIPFLREYFTHNIYCVLQRIE